MNSSEALQIAEIVVGSAIGLAAICYGGKIILKNIGLLQNSKNINHNNNNSPPRPSVDIGAPQTAFRDQRLNTEIPPKNKGMRPSSKNKRPKGR